MNKIYHLHIKGARLVSLLSSILFLIAVQTYSLNKAQSSPIENLSSDKLLIMLDKALELRHSNSDSAFIIVNKVIEFARLEKDSINLATAYLRKAILFKTIGELNEASRLLTEALNINQIIGDSIGVGRVRLNIGQLHKQSGSYGEAIEEMVRAIQLFEAEEQNTFLKVGYSTLASLYLLTERYNLATKSYHNLLQLALEENDSTEIRRAQYNLGITHFYKDEYSQAHTYLNKALLVAKKQNDLPAIVQMYNAIGSVFYVQDLNDQAIKEFEIAYRLLLTIDFDSELAKVVNNLATIYESKQEWNKAIPYYFEAAKLAEKTGSQSDLSMIYFNLSSAFESMGAPDSALHYYREYDAIQDSLFSVSSRKQVIEMQEKYESVKKDQAITLLNKEKVEQKATLEKRNLLLITVGLISLLLLTILVNYLNKLKVQRKLTKKTQELNQQKVMKLMDENSTKTLNAYLEGETTERKRLAEALHDSLGSQLATVNIYYEHIEKKLQESKQRTQLKKANALLKTAYTEVRKIAHDLNADTLSDFGLEAAIINLCKSLSDSEKFKVQFSSVGLEKKLSIHAEQAVYHSVQELIANLIKHADADQVKVILMEKNNELYIQIIDDGKGYKPSNEKTREGIGLRNIRRRIESLKGVFTIAAQKPGGTKATLCIPYTTNSN